MRLACGVEIATKFCDSDGKRSVLLVNNLRVGRPVKAMHSWSLVMRTMSLERFHGPQRIGTVVPSVRAMTRFAVRMALTRASRKSQPGMTSVSKRLTKLKNTIPNRVPSLSKRLMVSEIGTSRFRAPPTLSGDLSGRMWFWKSFETNEYLMKPKPAPDSNATITRVAACF